MILNLEDQLTVMHPHPTLFLNGYDREIVTRKRKAPTNRLPLQQIRGKKKKKSEDTDSKQREKKIEEKINIVDTPKKLVRSFTELFLGKKATIITSKHGTTIFFPFTILL